METHVISREIAAQKLGQPSLKGFYITRIYSYSSAEKAGLKRGDFILTLDGEKLTASGPENEDDLSTLIRQYDIGKTVELTVLRGKTEMKIPVELARSPRLQREMKKYRNDDFEFTARDVSFFDTAEEQWNNSQCGALIEDVKAGSWAELGSLYVGDLILEVDGQPVGNVDALRHRMEEIATSKKNVVVMKVLRGIHTAYLEIEPNWKSANHLIERTIMHRKLNLAIFAQRPLCSQYRPRRPVRMNWETLDGTFSKKTSARSSPWRWFKKCLTPRRAGLQPRRNPSRISRARCWILRG